MEETKQQATANKKGIPSEENENTAESTDRTPREDYYEELGPRGNGVKLPKLVESDEDNETEEEEENLTEEPEDNTNMRTTTRNRSVFLESSEDGEERRNTINKNNLSFSMIKNPEKAIEGDTLVFPHSNLWFQGRLACRFDTLNNARSSGWRTNRFKVNEIRAIDDPNNSRHLPETALFNLSYNSDWILGTHGAQEDEDNGFKVILGCDEIQKINLASIKEPVAVRQKFVVNLLSPEQMVSNAYLTDSGGMMYWSPQQRATINNKYTHQTVETAELTIITEGNIIRRMQLNNNTVATEVDTCSIVSVLTSDRLGNKIMMITGRTEFKLLGHVHPGDSNCGIEMLHEIH